MKPAPPTRPRLTKEDGDVDWSWPAVRLHNLIRGLHPWPHASRVPQRSSCDSSPLGGLERARRTPQPARSSRRTGDHLLVATGDGALDLVEVQAEGKRQDARARIPGGPSGGRGRPVCRSCPRHDRAAPASPRTRSSGGLERTPTCPSAIASARTGLRDDRDRALAAGDRNRRAAMARGARSRHRPTFSEPADRAPRSSRSLEILRLSAYQLLHLTRVPASAVVDDGVNLARRASKRAAPPASSTPSCARSRASGDALPLPPRPARSVDRDAALDYFSHHAVASAVARDAVVRRYRVRGD